MTTTRNHHAGHVATGPELYRDPHVYARRWYTLGVLCLSLVIVFVGNTSLNVVIPTLSRKLHATNVTPVEDGERDCEAASHDISLTIFKISSMLLWAAVISVPSNRWVSSPIFPA